VKPDHIGWDKRSLGLEMPGVGGLNPQIPDVRWPSGTVPDLRLVGSTPARGCCVPTPTQRAITGSVNEYYRTTGYGVEGLVWLTGAVVCLSCCVSRHRYHYLMPISCHFQDCKRCCSTSLLM